MLLSFTVHVDYIMADVPSQKVLGLNLLVNCLYFHFKLIFRDRTYQGIECSFTQRCFELRSSCLSRSR